MYFVSSERCLKDLNCVCKNGLSFLFLNSLCPQVLGVFEKSARIPYLNLLTVI